MKNNEDKERLEHMKTAIDKIERYTEDIDLDGFERSEMTQDAVYKNLEIIGEAAYKISEETKEIWDHIEWRKIEGLRHKLVHDYYKIDLGIIWQTKSKSLPQLKVDIEKILKEGSQQGRAVYNA